MTITLQKLKIYLVMLFAGLLLSCEETDTVNQDILDIVPGGRITTSISGGKLGVFSLTNDEFPSYGCYEDIPNDDTTSRRITLLISGEHDGKIYYIEAMADLSATSMKFITENPDSAFTLNEVKVNVQILDDTTHLYYGNTSGYMAFSNYGQIGEDVTINFFFNTSIMKGFSNMEGTVTTKYVLAEY